VCELNRRQRPVCTAAGLAGGTEDGNQDGQAEGAAELLPAFSREGPTGPQAEVTACSAGIRRCQLPE
jgi:hypothetical protein